MDHGCEISGTGSGVQLIYVRDTPASPEAMSLGVTLPTESLIAWSCETVFSLPDLAIYKVNHTCLVTKMNLSYWMWTKHLKGGGACTVKFTERMFDFRVCVPAC